MLAIIGRFRKITFKTKYNKLSKTLNVKVDFYDLQRPLIFNFMKNLRPHICIHREIDQNLLIIECAKN